MESNFQLNKDQIFVSKNKGEIFYPDIFTDICFSVEATNFWFNNRNDIITDLVTIFSPQARFADIGAGNGYQILALKKHIPSLSYYLIEPNYNGCKNAKSRGLNNIYNCEAFDFDYKSTNINAIGLFDVIEHIKDDHGFLGALTERLSSGTYVYITVPTYQAFWNDMDEITGHFRRYTKSSLQELGKKSDLALVYSNYFFSYLTLPYLFFRILPYRLGKKLKQEEVIQSELNAHRFSGLASACFSPFHFIEKLLIRLNLPIPFGNSCIAIFKKEAKV